METKELIVNGTLHAKYQIEGDTLWLKMILPLHRTNEQKSKDMAIRLITHKENKQFKFLSHLNLD